ncbi:hypothetical protein ACFL5O_00555 [Myxococcota bacterium]
MARKGRWKIHELDLLISGILLDAETSHEQLWAFREALNDEWVLPTDAIVVGEPVSMLAVDYDGNPRRGLIVHCRKSDGSHHVVGLLEIHLPDTMQAAQYLAAYRRWMGLPPYPDTSKRSSSRRRDTGTRRQ